MPDLPKGYYPDGRDCPDCGELHAYHIAVCPDYREDYVDDDRD